MSASPPSVKSSDPSSSESIDEKSFSSRRQSERHQGSRQNYNESFLAKRRSEPKIKQEEVIEHIPKARRLYETRTTVEEFGERLFSSVLRNSFYWHLAIVQYAKDNEAAFNAYFSRKNMDSLSPEEKMAIVRKRFWFKLGKSKQQRAVFKAFQEIEDAYSRVEEGVVGDFYYPMPFGYKDPLIFPSDPETLREDETPFFIHKLNPNYYDPNSYKKALAKTSDENASKVQRKWDGVALSFFVSDDDTSRHPDDITVIDEKTKMELEAARAEEERKKHLFKTISKRLRKESHRSMGYVRDPNPWQLTDDEIPPNVPDTDWDRKEYFDRLRQIKDSRALLSRTAYIPMLSVESQRNRPPSPPPKPIVVNSPQSLISDIDDSSLSGPARGSNFTARIRSSASPSVAGSPSSRESSVFKIDDSSLGGQMFPAHMISSARSNVAGSPSSPLARDFAHMMISSDDSNLGGSAGGFTTRMHSSDHSNVGGSAGGFATRMHSSDHSNVGGSAGGFATRMHPSDHSNVSGSAGGFATSMHPSDHSNVSGSAGGFATSMHPSDHSNVGGSAGGFATRMHPSDHSNVGGSAGGISGHGASRLTYAESLGSSLGRTQGRGEALRWHSRLAPTRQISATSRDSHQGVLDLRDGASSFTYDHELSQFDWDQLDKSPSPVPRGSPAQSPASGPIRMPVSDRSHYNLRSRSASANPASPENLFGLGRLRSQSPRTPDEFRQLSGQI